MLSRFEQFSFVISGINRYIQKLERDEMVKYGFKGAYAQYLVLLHRYPEGLTLSQLCALCDRDKAAVSRSVSEMLDKGLLLRRNEHKRVYKARLLLTEEGQRAADFVCTRAQSAVAAVGSELTDEERAVFYATLDLIASNLEILTKEGIPQK